LFDYINSESSTKLTFVVYFHQNPPTDFHILLM